MPPILAQGAGQGLEDRVHLPTGMGARLIAGVSGGSETDDRLTDELDQADLNNLARREPRQPFLHLDTSLPHLPLSRCSEL